MNEVHPHTRSKWWSSIPRRTPADQPPLTLRVGDAAVVPAHTWEQWHIPRYVRKHAVLRSHTRRPIYAGLGGARIETDSTPSPRRKQPPGGNDARTLPGTGHYDPDDTEAHTSAPVRWKQIRSPAVLIRRRDLAVVDDVRKARLSVCGEHVQVALAG